MKNLLFLCLIALFSCNSTDTADGGGAVKAVAEAPGTSTAGLPAAAPAREKGESENVDFTVKINGYKGGGDASLIGILAGNNFKAMVAPIDADGTVRFQKDEPLPSGMYFLLLPDNRNMQLLIDEDQTFTLTTENADLVANAVVKGNKETEMLYDNLRYEADYQQKFNTLTTQMNTAGNDRAATEKARDALIEARKVYLNNLFKQNPNSFFASFKRAGQNPDLRKDLPNDAQVWHYRREFFDNVDMRDERLLRTPVVSNKLKRYVTELTPQNPDSIIASAKYLVDKSMPYPEYFKYFANWITLNYDQKESKLMDAHAIEVFMIQNYFTNERAFWSDSVQVFGLQQQAYEKQASLVGKKGQNVTASGPDGKTYSLYDIDADFTIVYMFNPDCEHCQEQTPQLVDFIKNRKDDKVQVFTIALDTEDKLWKDYVKKVQMDKYFTNVYDPSNRAIYPNWYVDVTPEIYVLDKNKKIIAKNLQVNQIQTILDQNM